MNRSRRDDYAMIDSTLVDEQFEGNSPSPPRRHRRAYDRFGNAGAGSGRGIGRQRIGSEEAVRHDLAIGHGRRWLTEIPDLEQRHMIAVRYSGIEEHPDQP